MNDANEGIVGSSAVRELLRPSVQHRGLCLEAPRGHSVKPELHWVPQDVRGARAVRHLPRRTWHRDGAIQEREVYPAGSKVGGAERAEPFDTEHGATEFGICFA